MNFSRNDFALDLSQRLNLPMTKALNIVDSVLVGLGCALSQGKRVEFRNFGVFEIVTRKAKIGRNPQKPGAGQYFIPARRSVRFRMGKLLTEKLNPE